MKVLEAPLAETKAAWAEFGQEDNHGLIGFGPDGEIEVVLPGHEFGKDEVEAKLDELLGD